MELESILKEILRTSVENSEVAGANFLVLKDGEEMVYVQAGMADREAGRERYYFSPVFSDEAGNICGCHDFNGEGTS